MDEEKKEKLIIEGNAIYEIDMECWKKKFGKQKESPVTENDTGKKGKLR